MRDIDVVLAAVFAEIGIKGDAEHAFMLRPDLHVRNAADELFLARFGIHADNAAPLALGNPNMIIRPPDHIPRGGKAFGDNDPFKRFRRGHRLCLLRRCAPRSRSAQKQQRHRACHDSGMVHPVPPDVSLCIGTRGPPPRGFRYCQKREALRVPVRQRQGKRLPRNGFLSGWRCLSRLKRPHPAGTREEGFGRGAGSCWNGRPHLSTAEQPQNFTHDG